MKSFDGRVAAITGAGSGIGRELSVSLSKQGCHLSLSDVNAAGLEETAELARAAGVTVHTTLVDVADRAAVHAWADTVVRDHGRVNLVFNNAGVSVGSTLEGVSYEDFEWIMNINFWGVVHGTKAFLPHLRAAGEGHIVNLSSVFGLIGVPGQGTYNATKFAVRGFTEALRQELDMTGGAVSATSVHPGGIKTNIARSSRMSANLGDFLVKDAEAAREGFDKAAMTTPAQAAETILRAVQKNKRRVLVGADAHVIDLLVRLMPTGVQNLTMMLARRLAH